MTSQPPSPAGSWPVLPDVTAEELAVEQAVLGSMLSGTPYAIAEAVGQLDTTDFDSKHALIWNSIVSLYGEGVSVDAIAVIADLARTNSLTAAGGVSYLQGLTDGAPRTLDIDEHLAFLRERGLMRMLRSAGDLIVTLGSTKEPLDVAESIDQKIIRAELAVRAIVDRRIQSDSSSLSVLLDETLDALERNAGHNSRTIEQIPTGFKSFDRALGMFPGQLIILTGGPSQGKSTLGLDLIRSAALSNAQTAVLFSSEMSSNDVSMRLMAAHAGVSHSRMRTGRLREEEWAKISEAISEMAGAPLYIDDSLPLTMTQLRSRLHRLNWRYKIRLVVIDNLDMVLGSDVTRPAESLDKVTRFLKMIARELRVVVVAISQLPTLPDLTAIEFNLSHLGLAAYDADTVLVIQRSDLTQDKRLNESREVDLFVVKNRNGGLGRFSLEGQPDYCRHIGIE